MNNGGKIAKGEAADNGSKFAEIPSPGLVARWTMYAAASLILIGSKDYYCISTLCSIFDASPQSSNLLVWTEFIVDVHTVTALQYRVAHLLRERIMLTLN